MHYGICENSLLLSLALLKVIHLFPRHVWQAQCAINHGTTSMNKSREKKEKKVFKPIISQEVSRKITGAIILYRPRAH